MTEEYASDPDAPEPTGYDLVVPFVVCQSQGGPYEDQAFVAGFQAGEIDRALKVAATVDADEVSFTVRTELLRQLELLGMSRGFPVMRAEEWSEGPEWSLVTFATKEVDHDS